MTSGLPVSRLINVTVDLSPAGAQIVNLSNLLIVGDSEVVNTSERIRDYTDITGVAADFGTTAPEYLAALLWFAQAPRPTTLSIGRWARTASKGLMLGGALTTAQKTLANFTAIVAGGFKVAIDGGAETAISALNFSAATNLNGVAAIISAALGSAATCYYDGTRFVIQSTTTGAASTIALPSAPASGVDIRTLMGWTSVLGATTIGGIVAETLLAAVAIMDGKPNAWYALAVAASVMPINSVMMSVADYVEASSTPHFLAATTQEAGALDPSSTTDLAYLIKAGSYKRSTAQYSSSNPYACVSLLSRILTTNYNQTNSVITLMYKNEPLITAETLNSTQANALQAKYANVFANYKNGTAIIQYGTVGAGLYIDEVCGADWLQQQMQVDVYNALYTSPTKIPQTDDGNNILANVIAGTCSQAVTNGLLGGGVWTSAGFGNLKTGDTIAKGFYVYQPPIVSQSTADRAARKSVAFKVAAKLAGAIHTVDIAISVNR